MKRINYFFGLLLISTFLAFTRVGAQEYKLQKEIPVDGDAGWDYLSVDPNMGHLFISHGTMVQVMDVKIEKTIGIIPNTTGVHGIALAPETGKGYISDGRIDSITIIDINTLATLGKIASSGKNPDAIIYDPFSKRVFTFNGRSNNITAIDVNTDKVVGTIQVSGKPEFAVSEEKGKM